MQRFSPFLAAALLLAWPGTSAHAHECPAAGSWLDGATGAPVTLDAAITRLAAADAILLGESHGFPDIHLWQATTAAAIADLRGGAQYGYEMLPRSAQPALDAWAAGKTGRAVFLADAGWAGVWGFASNAYDPILRLPRIQAAPGIALNVDRSLVRRAGREGWGAVPEAERQGLTDPAPALPEYLERLDAVMAQKRASGTDDKDEPADAGEKRARFVDAQLVWDRAFAEAIAGGLATRPDRPVVAFMGSGHVDYGHGVAHQLADLGVANVATAVTVFVGDGCEVDADGAGRPIADLVYGLPAPAAEPPPPPRPRIGVFIQNAPDGGGAEITRVTPDSPAEAAGFQSGDIVTVAAGQEVASAAELGAAIRSHNWGAWLPFNVKRDDEEIELVAKLPKAPTQ